MRDKLEEVLENEAEMNMTPMIDVVFLLIIFFLCIDFKILEAKLPANLPKDVGAHTTDVEPQEKLNIQIVCENWGDEKPRKQLTAAEVAAGRTSSHYLVGHKVHWRVGPQIFHTIDELLVELKRIHADPSKLQKDPATGEMKVMGVVVEPGPETTYGDVASTLDAIGEADFNDISFGGGLGARKGEKKGD